MLLVNGLGEQGVRTRQRLAPSKHLSTEGSSQQRPLPRARRPSPRQTPSGLGGHHRQVWSPRSRGLKTKGSRSRKGGATRGREEAGPEQGTLLQEERPEPPRPAGAQSQAFPARRGGPRGCSLSTRCKAARPSQGSEAQSRPRQGLGRARTV